MPTITNFELVERLLVATDKGKVDWQPTARADEFTASFGGKWTLVLRQDWLASPLEGTYRLDFKNAEGEILVRGEEKDDQRVPALYEMARRHALSIDEALADLLNEIDRPSN